MSSTFTILLLIIPFALLVFVASNCIAHIGEWKQWFSHSIIYLHQTLHRYFLFTYNIIVLANLLYYIKLHHIQTSYSALCFSLPSIQYSAIYNNMLLLYKYQPCNPTYVQHSLHTFPTYEARLCLITSICATGILITHSRVSFFIHVDHAVIRAFVSSHTGGSFSSIFQRRPFLLSQPVYNS